MSLIQITADNRHVQLFELIRQTHQSQNNLVSGRSSKKIELNSNDLEQFKTLAVQSLQASR
ncbi:MAG: hypothetical protein ABJL72_22245 [Roseobacter sp.]